MNSDTPVTDAAFEAFLHCETKAYLLHESLGSQSIFVVFEQGLSQQFKQRASEWLRSSFGDDEVYVGTPSQRTRQALLWRAQWETTRDPTVKRRLIAYNQEDCQAVEKVAEAIANICSERPSTAAEAISVNVSPIYA